MDHRTKRDQLAAPACEKTWTFKDRIAADRPSDYVPDEYRNETIKGLKDRLLQLDENLPDLPDIWDFAPQDDDCAKHKQIVRQIDRSIELKKKCELTQGEQSESRRLDAIYQELLDDFRIPPKSYDRAKYQAAIDVGVANIISIAKEKVRLERIIRNLEQLEDREVRIVNRSITVRSVIEMLEKKMNSQQEEFQLLYIPEGYVNDFLYRYLCNPHSVMGDWQQICNLINVNPQNMELNLHLFVEYLKGHFIARSMLYIRGSAEDIYPKLPELLMIVNAKNPYTEFNNYYLVRENAILYNFQESQYNREDQVTIDMEGDVVFRGSWEDAIFQAGAEEMAHAFYYNEKQRYSQKNPYRSGFEYHSTFAELNALYAQLSALRIKYGSIESIPEPTYQSLITLIHEAMAVNFESFANGLRP